MHTVELPLHTEQECLSTVVRQISDQENSIQPTPKNDINKPQFLFSEPKPCAAPNSKKEFDKNLKKMGLGISLITIFVGAIVFCAIYFTKDHSKIQIQLIREGSGDIQGQNISYEQHSVKLTFHDKSEEEMTLFKIQQMNVPTGRFLSDGTTQETSDLTCYYANSQSTSDTLRLCNQADPTDPSIFQYDTIMDGANFIQQVQDSSESNTNGRILEEGETTSDRSDVADKFNQIVDELKSESGITLSLHLEEDPIEVNNHQTTFYGNNGPVITQNVENLINPSDQTSTVGQNDPLNSSNSNRLLSFIKLGSIVQGIVDKITKTAPIVFGTAGTVAGGVAGVIKGPKPVLVGIVQGTKLGIIPFKPSPLPKTCFPKSTNIKYISLTCTRPGIVTPTKPKPTLPYPYKLVAKSFFKK